MIIDSLLQNDFYKFSMGQIALHQFPSTQVKYQFKCRNDIKWTERHHARLQVEVKSFCNLRFTEEELMYLSDIRFFKSSYIDFLRLYQPNTRHLLMEIKDDHLHLSVQGSWFTTIYWEVPLLAMINEIYFEGMDSECIDGWKAFYRQGREKLKDKIKIANHTGFSFADFGTRRRFSGVWQNEVVETLKTYALNFTGTSNVYLAKKHNVKPIGTMAHEIFMVAQAIDVPLVDSQKRILQAWANEYRGDLGIALTDTIGIDAFLRDFDLYFAKLYDGLRHDSGSAYEWANKVIDHYEKLGLDPKTKTLVFSDGLDFDKCADLYITYKDKINVSMGIGTNITNDFDGVTPLQIVMKIVECNGKPVAKISDSPGKGMCRDEEYVSYLKKVFGVR